MDRALIDEVAGNIAEVKSCMAAARAHAGLDDRLPAIIAVSKRQPENRIRAALAAGHRLFGENRVQEAADRWPALRRDHDDVALHMVGALQSNKAAEAVRLFDAIHSLDRPKLARALAKALADSDRRPDLFIQVNTGEEPQKGGVLPADLEALLALARDELALPVRGLMCLPPADDDPALHFALLANLARRHDLDALSMGMSGDYETAACLGADYVRVGTAIFGAREQG